MNTKQRDQKGTADREISTSRIFDAPPGVVFQMWTDPKHVAEWWGPNGFTNTIHEMDVKPGGIWRFTMHGPDGTDYPNKIVFLEVDKPNRLVYDHGDEDQPRLFHVTVTFTAVGNKTRLDMCAVFETAEARDEKVKKNNAIEGMNQHLGRLAAKLAQMSAAKELIIKRTFNAPRDLVFRAWTETDRLQKWWGPKGFTNPRCEIDLRPQGEIRIDMKGPDGNIYPMSGVYCEIVRPERLVFTSSALDAAGKPLFEVLTTVSFAEVGGKTEMTLHASVSNVTAEAAPYLAGMEQGWSQSLDRLAEEVES